MNVFGSPILWSLGLLSGLATLATLVSLVIWWIVRKKQHRIWLPTVRILPLEQRILPRLIFQTPPMLFFLCFFGMTLAFIFLTTKPTSQVYKPLEPMQSRFLIFVDLSPSVSGSITLEELKDYFRKTCEHLLPAGKVYFASSLSHHPEIVTGCENPVSSENFYFHRPGLQLGEAIRVLLTKHSDFNQLYLISDQNQHTWSGFNWNYLSDEIEVFSVNVQSEKYHNIWINEAKRLSQGFGFPTSNQSDWDVELLRTSDEQEAGGTLQVYQNDSLVKEQPYAFPKGKRRITTRVEGVPVVSGTDADNQASVSGSSSFVEFRLISGESTKTENSISLDDSLRVASNIRRQSVSIISENAGEQTLEDPLGPLQKSLETIGFTVEKRDFIADPPTSLPNQPPKSVPDHSQKKTYILEIFAGGMGAPAERLCPLQGELDTRSKETLNRDSPKKMWLLPTSDSGDFFEMCRCLHRLFPPSSSFREDACQHVHTAKDWVSLLPSLGGKQLGGNVGITSQALGFFFPFYHDSDSEKKSPISELLVLTTPLTAQKSGRFSTTQIPLIVKELLTWHGLYDQGQRGQKDTWPRFKDIAGELWDQKDMLDKAINSNVPLGESEWSSMDLSEMPRAFNPLEISSLKSAPMKRDLDDPIHWIKLAVVALATLTILEIAVWTTFFLRRLARLKKKNPSLAILLILIFSAINEKSFAKVDFAVIGSPNSTFTTKQLAREVAARTSIELTTQPAVFPQMLSTAYDLPWLWVAHPPAVLGKDHRLPRDMVLWIKRGGFLIIETSQPTSKLQELTAYLEDSSTSGSSPNKGWLPLPPDHELMRSFYLLDALPDCQGEIWRGLQFDGRLAVLAVPYGFLDSLKDQPIKPSCGQPIDQERSVRIFVNLIMVALATDYKKDQIHLPEILKRLR